MKDALKITFILFAGIFLSAAPYLPANPTTQAMLAAVAKKRGAGGSTFPTTNLVAFYALDEASGNAISTNPTGKDFTDVGTVQSASSEGPGANATVRLLVEANNEAFTRADDDAFDVGTGDFSIAGWAKLTGTTAFNLEPMWSKRADTTNTSVGWNFGFNVNNGTPKAVSIDSASGVSDGTTEVNFGATAISVNEDTWFHFVVTYDRDGNMEAFINNGAALGTVSIAAASGTLSNAEEIEIGRLTFGETDAHLTHFAVWTKVLDSTERTALYNGGSLLAP